MKIYVTGLGVVSGIGLGVAENIASLRKHQHGMGKVTLFPTELDVPVSEVKYSNEELKRLLSLDIQKTFSQTALLGMLRPVRFEYFACRSHIFHFCRWYGFE